MFIVIILALKSTLLFIFFFKKLIQLVDCCVAVYQSAEQVLGQYLGNNSQVVCGTKINNVEINFGGSLFVMIHLSWEMSFPVLFCSDNDRNLINLSLNRLKSSKTNKSFSRRIKTDVLTATLQMSSYIQNTRRSACEDM